MLTSGFIYNDELFDNKIPTGNSGATSLSYKVRIDGKQYFMKLLRPELQDKLRNRTLFYKEFEIGSSISSEYVAKYERICEDSDGLYILMEYIYGSTVEDILSTDKGYFANEQNIWKFLLQLLEGIRCFHRQGIAYLDFSPNNIMLTQVGSNVKIVDLGFCFNNAYGHTAGTTPLFAPPEINNINDIDERSDIYAIGRLVKYIQEKSGAKYSKQLNKIVNRCLNEKKEKRFASTDEMMHAIRRRNLRRNILLSSLLALLSFTTLFTLLPDKKTIDTVSLSGVDYHILSHEEGTCEVTGGEGDEWNIYIAGHATIDGKQYRTTQVASEAFKGTPIKSVFLPEGIETISNHSFADCDSVVTIYIPSTVKNINGAFCGMKNLRSVRIPREMTTIGNAAFVLCTSLNNVDIPEGVERIGLDAFAKCSSLENIILPQSLKAIERGVFWECTALREITIPAGVSEIGDYAFYNCTALRDVYNHAVEPQKITMIFNTPQVTVHVPAESLEAYKKDFNWREYNLVGDL
ncbi:MAG: leucine-rich repeat protein [Bacteroidaceae bacterium]|nr:leucine-rich repeat protein [Bacteroidaceae bacterium]